MSKTCIWCKQDESQTSFLKKAHTIPKSLGGQNYNQSVCDNCNHYFGAATQENRYSIETALKETFCLSRQRFLSGGTQKRKIGNFKSIFFEVKERNGKIRLAIKRSFLLNDKFQRELCRNFKRGLLKMWFEEYDRQSKNNAGNDEKYNAIRLFSRYNLGNPPVIYFERRIGLFLFTKREAETPILIMKRMKYLYEDSKFTEIEFLGQVFGFPTATFSQEEFDMYLSKSIEEKKQFFSSAIILDKLTDIDFALSILDK